MPATQPPGHGTPESDGLCPHAAARISQAADHDTAALLDAALMAVGEAAVNGYAGTAHQMALLTRTMREAALGFHAAMLADRP